MTQWPQWHRHVKDPHTSYRKNTSTLREFVVVLSFFMVILCVRTCVCWFCIVMYGNFVFICGCFASLASLYRTDYVILWLFSVWDRLQVKSARSLTYAWYVHSDYRGTDDLRILHYHNMGCFSCSFLFCQHFVNAASCRVRRE